MGIPTSSLDWSLENSSTREHLSNVIHDEADRVSISSRLMRYRDQSGQDWAEPMKRGLWITRTRPALRAG